MVLEDGRTMELIQLFTQKSYASSKYSLQLDFNNFSIESLVKSNWVQYKINPKQLLIDAAGRTKNRGSRYALINVIKMNISTLCIVNLDEQKNTLYTSYIGDSGYLILR